MAYGYEAAGETRVNPTVDDLQLLDEVHEWCFQFLTPDVVKKAGLPRDAALLLWLRAENVTWDQIKHIRRQMYDVPAPSRRGKQNRHKRRRGGGKSLIPGGNSKTSLLHLHQLALEHVTASLNRSGVTVKRRPMPVEAIEVAEPPRSMDQRIEDVVDQLNLESVVLQRVVVALVLAERTPGGTKDLREAKLLLDREIHRRLAA